MRIGVTKEIKNHEYRIGLTPASVRELVAHGHQVLVERGGGRATGFDDDQYLCAGARLADTAGDVFDAADLIIKVKEPQPTECKMLREGQILFTYLHLAPDRAQTELLLASGASCIAYETVTDQAGTLPLLAPMSEVAGRLSVQAAAHHLEKPQGGSGVLLGGVPGVAPGRVLIIGGGVVGSNAAKMAIGLGADVTLMDASLPRLRQIDDIFGSAIKTCYATEAAISSCAAAADVVIGAVLIPGAAAPKLIRRPHLADMRDGSVIVDVAIDQGGCFETSRATTHQEPVYLLEGVVHYCVANMPGGVAHTATIALNNATLRFVLNIADQGLVEALNQDPHLLNGLNIHRGRVTHAAVAQALGYDYRPAAEALNAPG